MLGTIIVGAHNLALETTRRILRAQNAAMSNRKNGHAARVLARLDERHEFRE